jgi:copper chaperone NosL
VAPAPKPRRTLLAGAALVALTGAAGLFLQYGQQQPGHAFVPPDEDICIVAPARVSEPHAFDPASGLAIFDARPIPVDARCPVCGMYPARFPKWAAQIIFDDGSAHFFDSPVDLFMFLDEPQRFDAQRTAANAAALYVANFNDGQWLDARQAVFVFGSSARGPMRGPDLPAFADANAANAFIAERGGQAVGFEGITGELLGKLRDATHAHHMH